MRQKGFSLLELIVVIAIMATVTGVVIPRINFGGDKKQIRTEATRLAELFRRASDESIFKSAEIGVRFTDGDYQFLKLEGGNRTGKWVSYEDKMFRKREWPEGFEVELQIAGVPVILESADEAKLMRKRGRMSWCFPTAKSCLISSWLLTRGCSKNAGKWLPVLIN